MVFVADTIPRELARIVEFMNEQMRADVRAVELSWFESDGGITALTPRVIGETERALGEKSARTALAPIGRDAWIQQHLSKYGPATMDAAETYIQLVDEAGGEAEVTNAQGSIIAVFKSSDDVIYPMTLSHYGKGSVQLCLSYLVSRPAFASTEIRQELYDELVSVVGPLSTKTLNGFPAFPATRLNDPAVRDGVRDFLIRVVRRLEQRND